MCNPPGNGCARVAPRPRRRILLGGMFLAILLPGFAPGAAFGQLADLHAMMACIDHPETPECVARLREPPPPPPPPRKPAPPKEDEPPVAAGAPAVPTQAEAGASPRPGVRPARGDRLAAIIAHVQAGKASESEMDALEAAAAKGLPNAVEVLAWCYLEGRGREVDLVRAYWLYRQAAELGVANAAANQRAIYDGRMTGEQRQRILIVENARTVRPLASASR
jgi:hypothetical protein